MIDLSDNVQVILDQLSFKHRTIDKNTFIITKDGCRYNVFLESLPEVRIERTELLDYFEWHDSIQFAQCAAYYVNDTPCLAFVLVDEHQKVVRFREEFSAKTGWALGVQIYQGLAEIDQTVEAFREACSVDEDLYKLRLEELYQQELIKELNNEL